ncbi:MAG: MarR family transcriptional regulator [Rhodococcus sp.]|uniref:MarR family winged helix-turn-helix transcriptional regulator n=1 Tax=Nocardiaceae TaxID=85025 RepID=UPI00050C3EE3|nr:MULTISPECIES: MarR family transcriptional regulator [Rhodococcus]OZD53291.1 MarR family transcriptional regulator [Rhodococcus sp. 06-1477-1B]KJV00601.1 putative MarR family transcriptional regulator [Rhodococcus sp. PML026]MBJ7325515.1 MarR family transcriptional regulator [Rhodococcus sp. (in: high G+C Gram-positive bacteria)]MBW4779265.1 MarR family transcriptional regulator [Rhodococcus fascians]MCX6491851.1 MarR family transcriptional regulator [Rhodococcus sp. (in: high G+C Gram-posit
MTNELALDRQVCFALYSASRATTAVYRPMLDKLGVTYPQYLVLLVLWEKDGRGVKDICAELDLDTGTLSPMLKRLEGLGFIERRRLSSDERRVEIHLTETGSDLRAEALDIPRKLAEKTGMDVGDLVKLKESLDALTSALHHTDSSTTEGES